MYEVPVERGKIREFAKAVMSDNAQHSGPDAVIPPTFLTIGGMTWYEPDADDPGPVLDFDMNRVLHAEQEYRFPAGPPRAGTVLTATARLGEQWEKQGSRGGLMRFAQLITEFRDPSGEIVAEEVMTMVETAAPVKGTAETAAPVKGDA